MIKPFQILSPVLMTISHENTIETSLTSKKCRLAKFCKVDAWKKQVFLVGFSLTFRDFCVNPKTD